LLIFILHSIEQNLVVISAVVLVVFYCRLGIQVTRHGSIARKHDVIRKTGST